MWCLLASYLCGFLSYLSSKVYFGNFYEIANNNRKLEIGTSIQSWSGVYWRNLYVNNQYVAVILYNVADPYDFYPDPDPSP
jgi:hypothetical protein